MSELFIKNNKYVGFKYKLEKKYEAGVTLAGLDVKSIRANQFEVREAFVREEKGELYLWNIIFFKSKQEPQKRKLLLHKKEIEKIKVMLKDKKNHGYVLSVKINERNKIKIDIGIGSIKKKYEKRTSEKRSTEKRQLEREQSSV